MRPSGQAVRRVTDLLAQRVGPGFTPHGHTAAPRHKQLAVCSKYETCICYRTASVGKNPLNEANVSVRDVAAIRMQTYWLFN